MNVLKQFQIFLKYLGTSNWAEDYFTTTAGVAFVFNAKSSRNVDKSTKSNLTLTYNLRDQVKDVFGSRINSIKIEMQKK